jgi:1,4-dihydroxy-6-naphthoate synthase
VTPPVDLAFGFSPCPNDTFAFWAAVHGMVPTPGFRLQPQLADIEELNVQALGGFGPPLTKLSVPAFARVATDYAVLPSGAALGTGCGPLVVTRQSSDAPRTLADLRGRRVAIPGMNTTAFLLFGLLGPGGVEFVPKRFDRVMPAVASGECAAGLVIHESRFTYRDHGLRALADLGELWEQSSGGPLPLGVIAARRDLPAPLFTALGTALAASVRMARSAPELPADYVRAHSQELDAKVCRQHIELYVNDFTVELGDQGRAAIAALLQRGRARGLLPAGPSPWRENA